MSRRNNPGILLLVFMDASGGRGVKGWGWRPGRCRRDTGPFASQKPGSRCSPGYRLKTGELFCKQKVRHFSSVVRFCLYAEKVSHSPFGVDVAGFAGVGFNFFAEAADVDIYGADIPGIVCAPDEV